MEAVALQSDPVLYRFACCRLKRTFDLELLQDRVGDGSGRPRIGIDRAVRHGGVRVLALAVAAMSGGLSVPEQRVSKQRAADRVRLGCLSAAAFIQHGEGCPEMHNGGALAAPQ